MRESDEGREQQSERKRQEGRCDEGKKRHEQQSGVVGSGQVTSVSREATVVGLRGVFCFESVVE